MCSNGQRRPIRAYPVTERQREALRWVVQLTILGGRPPTLRELGEVLACNHQTAHAHVRALLRRGLCARLAGCGHRSIEVTDRGLAVVRDSMAQLHDFRPEGRVKGERTK